MKKLTLALLTLYWILSAGAQNTPTGQPANQLPIVHDLTYRVDSRTYHRIQEILHEEVPFAAQGGSVQGHLKRKQLQGPTPNQYVTDITWNVYDWAWA